jgi:hypothetical protein
VIGSHLARRIGSPRSRMRWMVMEGYSTVGVGTLGVLKYGKQDAEGPDPSG